MNYPLEGINKLINSDQDFIKSYQMYSNLATPYAVKLIGATENANGNGSFRTSNSKVLNDQIPEQFRTKSVSSSDLGGSDCEIDDYGDYSSSNITAGRWTRAEHELFLQGLKIFGKDWRKVASVVKTRSVIQIRTHAQKYFIKQTKLGNFTDYETFIQDQAMQDISPTERKFKSPDVYPPFSSAKKVRLQLSHTDINSKQYEQPNSHDHNVKYILGYHDVNNWNKRDLKENRFSTIEGLNSNTDDLNMSNGIRELGLLKTPLTQYPPPEDYIYQPSPAATGRRKHAELAVANSLTLAAATSSKNTNDVSSSLKSLNPKEFDGRTPSTPWTTDVKVLGTQSNSKYFPNTPIAQQEVTEKIRTIFASGDVETLVKLLDEVKTHPFSLSSDDSTDIVRVKHEMVTISDILNYVHILGRNILLDLCATTIKSITRNVENENIILQMIVAMIDHGSHVNMRDDEGNTCVHYLASTGYNKVGKYILSKGCPINITNSEGNTAMHIAAKFGNIEFVEMLLALGAHCHVHNHEALSALDLAGSERNDTSIRFELRKRMFTIEPRLRTLILYHEDCLQHSSQETYEWEGPDRLIEIMKKLHDPKEFPNHELEICNKFECASVELLSRVHSPDYITFVNNLTKQLQDKVDSRGNSAAAPIPFTPQVQKFIYHQTTEETKKQSISDTIFTISTLQAARRAAGAVAHAVDCILLGRNRNAFCVVRPPGHHSGYRGLLDEAKSCGFCIFNSIAAGALHALEVRHCERVAIIDLDIHHGNGTEDIIRKLQNPSKLFFFSLHLFDKQPADNFEFFPGSGHRDDMRNNIINVPLMPLWHEKQESSTTIKSSTFGSSHISSGRDAYRLAIQQRLLPALRAFNPSLILLSTGFDAAAGDIGNQKMSAGMNANERGMDLTPEDFRWVTKEIMHVADICCHGRVVSVLEGGYGNVVVNKQKKGNTNQMMMNRNVLCSSALVHIKTLVDPYIEELDIIG